eukprot:scpid77496/ scgid29281/ 
MASLLAGSSHVTPHLLNFSTGVCVVATTDSALSWWHQPKRGFACHHDNQCGTHTPPRPPRCWPLSPRLCCSHPVQVFRSSKQICMLLLLPLTAVTGYDAVAAGSDHAHW